MFKLRRVLAPPSIPPADTLGTSKSNSPLLSALSHPLPAGMRDLLPAEADSQGRLVGGVLRSFELHGFQRVALPVFEYAEVLEKGLGAIPPSSLLRFVEPESGEVVALRPDMTPQVARLVASRLPDGPFPVRLCYRGAVLRRRHERARHDQQVLQAGIELIGAPGVAGDLEVLTSLSNAVRAAGLAEFVIDLGHGALTKTLLCSVPEEVRAGLSEAFSLKDQAELVRRAERAGLSALLVRELSDLVELHGGEEVFERARKKLTNAECLLFVSELERFYRAAIEADVGPKIVVDLGETRSVDYYSGTMFQILAEGPGQAVASGGRYDGLLAAFGRELPAAGAAIQIDHLRWALASEAEYATPRALVIADPADEGARRAVAALRGAGIAAVIAEDTPALLGKTITNAAETAPEAAFASPDSKHLDYARAWRYSHLVRLDPDSPLAVRLSRVEANRVAELGTMPLSSAIEKMCS